MSGDPVSDVLNRAADRLEQPGVWAQGWDMTGGRDCMLTAVSEAAHDDCEVGAALHRLRVYLGGSVLVWNDAESRTAAEVVSALRQAAQLKGTE